MGSGQVWRLLLQSPLLLPAAEAGKSLRGGVGSLPGSQSFLHTRGFPPGP